MPRRDITFAHKIVLLEQIEDQLPNTSHSHLAEITGVLKSAISRDVPQQEKLRGMKRHCATDNRELPEIGRVKVRIQMLKSLSVSSPLA
jgi:hypothetical protein